ncbi:DUF6612 family protein [Tuberibacillus sp. Marseille-P3662]|uniref:DUF6612 family protein n=1 Tax=Tuberibacillus sp. Marseille-P3662 TaxID=1965358 RepID=UPI000A1C9095|nr:DUF6612 family protein [Tuberibacillus sp. Marseille-P3662]
MFKRISFVTVIVMALSLTLAGCGGKALQAKEVLEKAADASKDLDNYQMNADITMNMDAAGQSMKTQANLTSQIQNKPMLAHMTMKTNLQNQSLKTDMYMTKDQLYMQNKQQSKQWMKIKNPSSQQMEAMKNQNIDPAENLKKLKKYVDEFDMKEKDGEYVLSMTAKGDKVKEFYNDVAAKAMPQTTSQLQNVMDNMTFEDIKYTYHVNKDTYYPESMDMDMTLSVAGDENQSNDQSSNMELNQTMTMTFSKFNELDDISIPKKVKDNAKEVDMNKLGQNTDQ